MSYIGRTPTNAALTAADLADGIVSSAKIAADAVTSAKIADNAVVTAAINADAVTDAKIADDVVGTEHLTANEVDTTALGADAVTGAQLADDAVNSEHYTDGSIDTAHLADAQITTAKLSTAVLTGATDIGADLADADLFLVDDGAGGTIRKTAASRLKTYIPSSGRILQIVSSSETTERSTSSTSYGTNSSTLSVDITPATTSSKILLLYHGNGYIGADHGSMFFTIYRDSSDLGNSNKGLTNIKNAGNIHTNVVPTSITTFDEPNTTSQVTYTLTIRAGSGTAYVNYNSSRSRLTAFEIGA